MTIDAIVNFAYEHLLRRQYTGDQIRELIKQHAIEELNLSEQDAEALSWKEQPEIQDKIDATSFRDFYLWYYFNRVAPPHIDPSRNPPEGATGSAIKGKYDLTVYLIIRVTAKIDAWPPDKAVQEWSSNCYYELASSDQLKVLETEILHASPDLKVF